MVRGAGRLSPVLRSLPLLCTVTDTQHANEINARWREGPEKKGRSEQIEVHARDSSARTHTIAIL